MRVTYLLVKYGFVVFVLEKILSNAKSDWFIVSN